MNAHEESLPTALRAAVHGTGEAAQLAALQAKLAENASAAGVLDVAYRTVDSPVGPLLLATTEVGLVRIAFAMQDFDAVLQVLADRVSPRVLRAPGRLDAAVRQLQEYWDGVRQRFELRLDTRLLSGFRAEVVTRLDRIPYGRTWSYADLAAATGRPRAVRAVGTACALNPLPLVLPCHRVVRSDGAAGQYAGGAPAKQWLLGLESAALE